MCNFLKQCWGFRLLRIFPGEFFQLQYLLPIYVLLTDFKWRFFNKSLSISSHQIEYLLPFLPLCFIALTSFMFLSSYSTRQWLPANSKVPVRLCIVHFSSHLYSALNIIGSQIFATADFICIKTQGKTFKLRTAPCKVSIKQINLKIETGNYRLAFLPL